MVNNWCNEFNMRLSDKSKYFVINSDELDDEYDLVLDGIEIERVGEYKYLGYRIQETVDCDSHLQSRLQAA